jgi:hypothetical protein
LQIEFHFMRLCIELVLRTGRTFSGLGPIFGAALYTRFAAAADNYLMRFALRPSLFRPEFIHANSSLKFFGFWHALPVSEAYVHRSVEAVPTFLPQFTAENTIQIEFRVSAVAANLWR